MVAGCWLLAARCWLLAAGCGLGRVLLAGRFLRLRRRGGAGIVVLVVQLLHMGVVVVVEQLVAFDPEGLQD